MQMSRESLVHLMSSNVLARFEVGAAVEGVGKLPRIPMWKAAKARYGSAGGNLLRSH